LTLQIYFSHPSLVNYFFATPPIKLKLELQIGGGLLRANHLDQLFMMGESENTEQQSGPIYYTLFRQVHGVAAVPFYQPPQAL